MIWHSHWMIPVYIFGKGVSQSEAQNVVNMVHMKFQNYRIEAHAPITMSNMDAPNVFQRVFSFYQEANLWVITGIPILLFLIDVGILSLIWPNGFNDTRAQDLVMSLGFIFLGLMGLPGIVRKESILDGYHTGTGAVIEGIMVVIIGLALACIPLIGLFK